MLEMAMKYLLLHSYIEQLLPIDISHHKLCNLLDHYYSSTFLLFRCLFDLVNCQSLPLCQGFLLTSIGFLSVLCYMSCLNKKLLVYQSNIFQLSCSPNPMYSRLDLEMSFCLLLCWLLPGYPKKQTMRCC